MSQGLGYAPLAAQPFGRAVTLSQQQKCCRYQESGNRCKPWPTEEEHSLSAP